MTNQIQNQPNYLPINSTIERPSNVQLERPASQPTYIPTQQASYANRSQMANFSQQSAIGTESIRAAKYRNKFSFKKTAENLASMRMSSTNNFNPQSNNQKAYSLKQKECAECHSQLAYYKELASRQQKIIRQIRTYISDKVSRNEEGDMSEERSRLILNNIYEYTFAIERKEVVLLSLASYEEKLRNKVFKNGWVNGGQSSEERIVEQGNRGNQVVVQQINQNNININRTVNQQTITSNQQRQQLLIPPQPQFITSQKQPQKQPIQNNINNVPQNINIPQHNINIPQNINIQSQNINIPQHNINIPQNINIQSQNINFNRQRTSQPIIHINNRPQIPNNNINIHNYNYANSLNINPTNFGVISRPTGQNIQRPAAQVIISKPNAVNVVINSRPSNLNQIQTLAQHQIKIPQQQTRITQTRVTQTTNIIQQFKPNRDVYSSNDFIFEIRQLRNKIELLQEEKITLIDKIRVYERENNFTSLNHHESISTCREEIRTLKLQIQQLTITNNTNNTNTNNIRNHFDNGNNDNNYELMEKIVEMQGNLNDYEQQLLKAQQHIIYLENQRNNQGEDNDDEHNNNEEIEYLRNTIAKYTEHIENIQSEKQQCLETIQQKDIDNRTFMEEINKLQTYVEELQVRTQNYEGNSLNIQEGHQRVDSSGISYQMYEELVHEYGRKQFQTIILMEQINRLNVRVNEAKDHLYQAEEYIIVLQSQHPEQQQDDNNSKVIKTYEERITELINIYEVKIEELTNENDRLNKRILSLGSLSEEKTHIGSQIIKNGSSDEQIEVLVNEIRLKQEMIDILTQHNNDLTVKYNQLHDNFEKAEEYIIEIQQKYALLSNNPTNNTTNNNPNPKNTTTNNNTTNINSSEQRQQITMELQLIYRKEIQILQSRYKEELSKKSEEIVKVRQQILTLQKNEHQMYSSLQKAEQHIMKLQEWKLNVVQISEVQQWKKSVVQISVLQEWKKKHELIQFENQQLTISLSQAKRQLTSHNQINLNQNNQQSQISALSSQNHRLQNQLQLLKEQLSKLTQEKQQLYQVLNQFNQDYINEKEAFQRQVQNITLSLQTAETYIEEQTALWQQGNNTSEQQQHSVIINEVRLDLDKTRQEKTQLLQQLRQTQSVIKQLTHFKYEYERLIIILKQKQTIIISNQTSIKQLQTSLANSTRTYKELQVQFTSLKQRQQSKAKTANQNNSNSNRQEVNRFIKEVQTLKLRNRQLQAQIVVLSNENNQLKEVQGYLVKAEEHIKTMQQNIEPSISSYQSRIAEFNSIVVINETKISELNITINNYHLQIEQHNLTINNYHLQIEQLNITINNYLTQIEQLNITINNYHQHIQELNVTIINLNQQITNYSQQISKYQSNTNHQSQIEDLRRRLQIAQEELRLIDQKRIKAIRLLE